MLRKRSAPILLVSFGMLIAVAVVSGIGARQRAKETYRDILTLSQRYRRTDRVLQEIASGIYMVGLLARDYLLDPKSSQSARYVSQLTAERSVMENEFVELKDLIRSADQPKLESLRQEVEGYWNTLHPLFRWTDEQKQAQSWTFLREEVLPRRRAALSIASEVAKLTQANLDEQRKQIEVRQAAMARFILQMTAASVLLGVGIAGWTVFRMNRLERDSEAQRRRTETAERELRELSRQLVQAQEEERKSLSRELHDEIGQMLTALRMELRSLQDLRTAPEAQFAEHIDDAKRLAEQSLRALRDMAMGLRPAMLDDLGLGSAVQWQARHFSKRTGIPVDVRIEGLSAAIPEPHRTCIYRVVQEALTNCARHAHATSIHIAIERKAEEVRAFVKDDGVGFEPTSTRGRGLGLIGMQERVMELGGEVSLSSRRNRGTVLSARIPLHTERELKA